MDTSALGSRLLDSHHSLDSFAFFPKVKYPVCPEAKKMKIVIVERCRPLDEIM